MRIKGAMTILKKRAKFYGMTTEELVQWLDDRNDETIKVFRHMKFTNNIMVMSGVV